LVSQSGAVLLHWLDDVHGVHDGGLLDPSQMGGMAMQVSFWSDQICCTVYVTLPPSAPASKVTWDSIASQRSAASPPMSPIAVPGSYQASGRPTPSPPAIPTAVSVMDSTSSCECTDVELS
jgi:hypothetical protein